MITFTIALITLITAYFIYGSFLDKLLGIDPTRKTPVTTSADGVDFVPLPRWKIFMIQFLNIAGLGPIFGAIAGAKFGTSAFVWIVLGAIFAGGVHDYIAGYISLRNNGESLPETIGRILGNFAKQSMRIFTIVLLVLVGAVFVAGPAGLLAILTPESFDSLFWVIIIFIYYIVATLFPVDKVIGKIYPLLAGALMFMAVGILISLYVHFPVIPELTEGLNNIHPNADNIPIFPMLFITIACGAISGFHATQSPMMARCMKNESSARPVFYGAMITEGIVALIWAAAATYFFSPAGQVEFGVVGNAEAFSNPAIVVQKMTSSWLGTVGGILAILGVIAAPITSGDTALRSARLIASDFLRMEQKSISKRLLICIPIFLVTLTVLIYSLSDKNGFDMIWRYFAWCNQMLASVTLWAITVYLFRSNKNYWVTLLPAMFMTTVIFSYILYAPEGLSLNYTLSVWMSIVIMLVAAGWFFVYKRKN